MILPLKSGPKTDLRDRVLGLGFGHDGRKAECGHREIFVQNSFTFVCLSLESSAVQFLGFIFIFEIMQFVWFPKSGDPDFPTQLSWTHFGRCMDSLIILMHGCLAL